MTELEQLRADLATLEAAKEIAETLDSSSVERFCTLINTLQNRIAGIEIGQSSIEDAYSNLRLECRRKDARIFKLMNQLNEYQNIHNGTSIHWGIGQTITIDKPMQLLSVRRNGIGPFLCSIDGEGMTILFKTNAIAGPKNNPFNTTEEKGRADG